MFLLDDDSFVNHEKVLLAFQYVNEIKSIGKIYNRYFSFFFVENGKLNEIESSVLRVAVLNLSGSAGTTHLCGNTTLVRNPKASLWFSQVSKFENIEIFYWRILM